MALFGAKKFKKEREKDGPWLKLMALRAIRGFMGNRAKSKEKTEKMNRELQQGATKDITECGAIGVVVWVISKVGAVLSVFAFCLLSFVFCLVTHS